MIVVDRGGVIRYWSEDAERLTGHRAPDAVGQTLDLVVPPEYRPRHWAGFEAAMQTGTARAEGAAANIRGRPAGAAAVMVEPLPDDPAFFEL
jgi:PAS domain S-box-containing protein